MTASPTLSVLVVAAIVVVSLLPAGCERADEAVVVLDLARAFALAEATTETRRLELGEPAARPHLLTGFSWDEGTPSDRSFVWGMGEGSRLRFTILRPRDLVLRLEARSVAGLGEQSVRVLLQGEAIGTLHPDPSPAVFDLALPQRLVQMGDNVLELRYGGWKAPGGGDERPLAVAWYRLEIVGAEAPAPAAPAADAERLVLPGNSRLDFHFEAPARSELRLAECSTEGKVRVLLESDAFARREVAVLGGRRRALAIPLELERSSVVRLRLESEDAHGSDEPAVLVEPRVVSPAVARVAPPVPRPASGRFTPPSPRPNVLVYLVDTLRADRLGGYGEKRDLTPHLDAFAADGTLFERAIAQSSWTRASVASLFTGVWPVSHGTNGRRDGLSSEARTLAEVLHDAGYATAAVVTNPNVHRRFGLDQGFELYAHVEGTAPPSAVRREVFGWLDDLDGGRPFFLYVHTVEPHDPYSPPTDLRRRFAAAVPAGMEGKPGRNQKATPELVAAYAALYDAEVAWSDRAFGRLLAGLEERGLEERTLVVFVSDHGEELQEHGGWKHGVTLHAEVLDVPLLLRGPGLPAGRRIEQPVQHADLLPTILDYLALEIPPSVEGRSLLPLVLGTPAAEGPPPLFSYLELDGAPRMSVVAGAWKLIERRVAGEVTSRKLYRLEVDPGETTDLAAVLPILASYLGTLITARLTARDALGGPLAAPLVAPKVDLDEELEASLRALGYL